MKKNLLYAFAGLVLVFVFLLGSGLINVGVSPYFHHRLNEAEARIFDNALLQFREKVENGKFEEIQAELADGRRNKDEIIAEIKKAREQFGKPVSTEFFRSSPPESAAKYYENLDGTFYDIFYFTKTEKGEFSEGIQWVVRPDNEVQMLNYSGSRIVEWETKTRAREKYIAENYAHEIRISFGARFIEIRY